MPDVILMDIQMPYVNGLELTRRLRSDPRFGTVPIIALTAFAMSGDRERCLAAGMNDHIGKPIDTDLLYATVLRWLQKTNAAIATPAQ